MSNHAIEERLFEWIDGRRGRSLPARLFLPARRCDAPAPDHDPAAPVPLILFSHGVGGTRDTYNYLGRFWASHGFASVFFTHSGTDLDALRSARGRMRERLLSIISNANHLVEQPRDLSFALTQLLGDASLRERFDPQCIAAAGHSFGAYAALALAGLRPRIGNAPVSFRDERIKAVVAMSPPVQGRFGTDGASFEGIQCPVLSMIGGEDWDLDVVPPEARRSTFERTRHTEQFAVWISGAKHMAFSDHPLPGVAKEARDPRHHDWIAAICTAFWNAALLGDDASHRWLSSGAAETETAGAVRIEHRTHHVSIP